MKGFFHQTLGSEMYIVLEERRFFFTFPVLQATFEDQSSYLQRKFVYCQETWISL